MLKENELVKINDVDYECSAFTQEIQSKWEKHMQSQYLSIIKKNRNSLGDDYFPMLEKFFLDVDMGVYDFNTTKFYDFLQKYENFQELMYWCFTYCYKDDITKAVNRDELVKWIKENDKEAAMLFQRLQDSLVADKKKLTTGDSQNSSA